MRVLLLLPVLLFAGCAIALGNYSRARVDTNTETKRETAIETERKPPGATPKEQP